MRLVNPILYELIFASSILVCLFGLLNLGARKRRVGIRVGIGEICVVKGKTTLPIRPFSAFSQFPLSISVVCPLELCMFSSHNFYKIYPLFFESNSEAKCLLQGEGEGIKNFHQKIKAVTSCSTHKIDQQETVQILKSKSTNPSNR